MCIGACLELLGCCFCSALCSCCGCCACGGGGGYAEVPARKKFKYAKVFYLITWTATVVATWVLRDYASDGFAAHIGEVATFCGDITDPSERKSCAGGQIAMRISFANFCFFALLAVLTIGMTQEDDPRVEIHAAAWAIKLLAWAGALVGFFWVPSSAIYGYAQFARVGSGIFLVIQLVLLIDFVYRVNEFLTEADTKPAWALLVLGAALAIGLGFVALGFSYHWYTASPSCHLNIFFCTWSLILGLLVIGVLFVPNRQATAGLLTSGLVFLYCQFLLLSALSSEPPDAFPQCQRGSGANPRWIQIVGFFIALAAVLYSTYTAGYSSGDLFGSKPAEEDGVDSRLPYRADFFHIVYALASLYIAMLFSNWEVSSSFSTFQIDTGWISTWVKVAAAWLCALLYSWTVVAPALFPNRDFGVV